MHAEKSVVTGEMSESMVERMWVHEIILVMARGHRMMRGENTLELTDHNVIMVLCSVIVASH